MKKNIILSIIVLIFSSCSYRVFDFTIVSTKNIDLSKACTFEKGKKRIEGDDLVYWIFYIPLGRPSIKEAIDKAIETTPGSVAIVDGVVTSKSMWFVFSGYSAIVVEGTPLIDPALADNSKLNKYNLCKLNREGNINEIVSISKEAFEEEKSKIMKKVED